MGAEVPAGASGAARAQGWWRARAWQDGDGAGRSVGRSGAEQGFAGDAQQPSLVPRCGCWARLNLALGAAPGGKPRRLAVP